MGADRRDVLLLEWYDANARNLPWRDTSDPWAILISEVMAQQTQIARVVPAWTEFLDRYPTPVDLAGSDRAELIRLWAGLGYQRRAINLQRAAEIIATDGWPSDIDGLRRLPGVGPYTAAAVGCFAFGWAVPAIDTNLKRILSRWHGEALNAGSLTRAAAAALAMDRPSDWNQAMMDLGALICRPHNPHCDLCPVSTHCKDPSIYEPPARQTRYQGSVRQARAAILRTLAERGEVSEVELTAAIGVPTTQVETALEALEAESLIARPSGMVSLDQPEPELRA